MTPYWIMLERTPTPQASNLGVGVTAYSEADARVLVEAGLGTHHTVVSIRQVNDMRDLEQNHVVPNMGNWRQRGIWFPLDYEHVVA